MGKANSSKGSDKGKGKDPSKKGLQPKYTNVQREWLKANFKEAVQSGLKTEVIIKAAIDKLRAASIWTDADDDKYKVRTCKFYLSVSNPHSVFIDSYRTELRGREQEGCGVS
jgi:hypothetical protein